jgi:aspartate aminotransferase-like enzyme
VDSTGLIRHIRRVHHVRFANGQGDMAGTMIRIAHLGALGPWDLVTGLTALELGLVEQGVPSDLGAGPRAAQALLGRLPTLTAR